jgi:uncharacterized OsmC-like protein
MTGNVDLRAVQEPLKQGYREHPDSGRITLTARGAGGGTAIACSVDLGRAVYEAQAHAGVGGEGLDLRGTLGIDREAPVGFTGIRVSFAIDAPGATEEQLGTLQRKTERYCVVMQTLTTAPPIAVSWEP